ncbi:urocanate hydratase, partial [Pseudoalteromonas sp. SIMBA_153]
TDLEHALKLITDACVKGEARAVCLLGNAADGFSTLVESGITPDIVTDQTSADDPRNGYLPQGWSMEHAAKMRIDN